MNKTMLNDLLDAGFTERRAKLYLSILESEKKNKLYNIDKVEWAHKKGFTARSAYLYNLTEDNYTDYLSDYDYNRIFPLNSWQRIWVNDKLTLKMILNGTEYAHLMPDYYYYSASDGLRTLMDNPFGNQPADFLNALKHFEVFACKPNNGSTSVGFCKMSYKSNQYYLNDTKVSESTILKFVKEQTNYLYTEFIQPNLFYRQYSNLIHTLRLNTLNVNGNEPCIVNGCLRLPTKQASVANYLICSSPDIFNLTCDVNPFNGNIGKSLLVYGHQTKKTDTHPDNGTSLAFSINGYIELKTKIIGICKLLNSIEYMGFDIGMTDKGFKIMEINTHPGIEFGQLMCPIMKHPIFSEYFKNKISTLDNLPLENRIARNNIQR